MEKNIILKPSKWNMGTKKWRMGNGLANALFQWLRHSVDGTVAKGYQLVGVLDPDNPDPSNMEPPPDWRNPDVMMKAMCTWYGGAVEKALYDNGLIPVVRGRIAKTENLFEFKTFVGAEGFNRDDLIINTSEFVCKLRHSLFSEDSTIFVTPVTGLSGAKDIQDASPLDPANPALPPATVMDRFVQVDYVEDGDGKGWDLYAMLPETFYVHIFK